MSVPGDFLPVLFGRLLRGGLVIRKAGAVAGRLAVRVRNHTRRLAVSEPEWKALRCRADGPSGCPLALGNMSAR